MDRPPSEHPSWSIYCRACYYDLRGSPAGRCPECGLAFDRNDPQTFSRTPGPERLKTLLRRAREKFTDPVNTNPEVDPQIRRLAKIYPQISALRKENDQLWDHFTWLLGMLLEKGVITETDVQAQLEREEWGTLPTIAAEESADDGVGLEELEHPSAE